MWVTGPSPAMTKGIAARLVEAVISLRPLASKCLQRIAVGSWRTPPWVEQTLKPADTCSRLEDRSGWEPNMIGRSSRAAHSSHGWLGKRTDSTPLNSTADMDNTRSVVAQADNTRADCTVLDSRTDKPQHCTSPHDRRYAVPHLQVTVA